MGYLEDVWASGKCPRCLEKRNDVDERYSFNVYAGVMCVDCAIKGYKDGCGEGNKPMGTRAEYEAENGPNTYDEDY
jgi:hypothetical protein